MKKYSIIALAIAAVLPLAAKTIYVSADAGSGGDGSKAKPFAKIQQGLDIAQPGDTVELAPGVYYERVNFPRSGKYKKPIRLNGPRTAVIDGSVAFKQEWKKIPQYGPNAWHTKVPAIFFPPQVVNKGSGVVISPEGLIIQLYEKRVKSLKNARKDKYNIWYAPYLMRQGIGRSKMNFIKALAMYRFAEQDVIVSYGDGRDVSKAGLVFTPPLPSVVIDKADYCAVSGITIRNAFMGVKVTNSKGVVIENCRIMRSDRGIELANNSDRCTVRFCEISMDSVFRANPRGRGAWDAWKGHKRGGFWDRIAIYIRDSKGGHEVHDNYLHNHWGGIQDTGDNPDLNIHHNRIHEIVDDGLEPNGTERYCRWHHNYVTHSRCGCRIKCILKGPFFAYGNVFRNNIEDFRNFGTKNLAKADVFVYHNTSETKAAINNNKVPQEIGTPNYHYYNNFFVCNYIFAGGRATPDWHDAGNVYLRRPGDDSRWKKVLAEVRAAGFKSTSKFLASGKRGFATSDPDDFSITAESAAAKAGTDLSKFNLPGISEYASAAPDAGALPVGRKMFKVFRKPCEVEHLPAGHWPDPATKLTLPTHYARGLLRNI